MVFVFFGRKVPRRVSSGFSSGYAKIPQPLWAHLSAHKNGATIRSSKIDEQNKNFRLRELQLSKWNRNQATAVFGIRARPVATIRESPMANFYPNWSRDVAALKLIASAEAHSPLNGVLDKLTSIPQCQLLLDMRLMRFYRLYAEM